MSNFEYRTFMSSLINAASKHGHSSDDDIEGIAMLLTLSKNHYAEIHAELSESEPIYKLLHGRMLDHGYTMEPPLTLFLMHKCKGNIGFGLMLACVICYSAPKTELNRVSLSFMCESVFPYALPSYSDLSDFWDMQKVDGKNAIDDPSLWR